MRRVLACVPLALLCALLQACGSGGSNSTPPSQPQISIVAPADGTVLMTLPATVKVSFSNGADPGAMKALLDGVDISAQFAAADSSGMRQVQIDRPAVNLGKNQLQVSSGSTVTQSSFVVALSNGGNSGIGASATLPLLIPIQSRVLTGPGNNAVDYNFALYEDPNNPTNPTYVRAPEGAIAGFQVAYLSRADLSVVSNQTVPNPDPGADDYFGASALSQALGSVPAGCGTAGCLLLVQSLQTIGYTPCSYPYPVRENDCQTWTTLFSSLGGSGRVGYANETSQQVAYSFVGNTSLAPLLPGTNFERLTCSASSGCEQNAAPSSDSTAPSDATLAQIGNFSGVLVRDNFNNYTYAQNAPPVSFSSGVDTTNVSHRFTINGVDYYSGFARNGKGGQLGGFHVVILDRTTLALKQNQWWQATVDQTAIQAVHNFLAQPSNMTYGSLVFFAAFGNTSYSGQTARNDWYDFSTLLPILGGTQQVFFLANNPQNPQPPNVAFIDDYTLVGGPIDWNHAITTGLESEVGAELSSVISRETELYPLSSDMEGFLEMDHEGYYDAKVYGHNVGLSSVATAEMLSASLRNPTPWPFPGPDTAKSQAAYTWISQQLCCDDVRSAYVNQNVDPSIWLSQLQQLSFNANVLPGSDQADFDAMKAQLATEFQYVRLVRLFQGNVRNLFQDQQANIALLLQQAQDDVLANLTQVQLTDMVPAHSLSGTLEDLFSVAAGLAGFIPGGGAITAGVKTALALGTVAVKDSASTTNSPTGQALRTQENVEIAAGNLAGQAADEFAQTLVSLGDQFDRIVIDWGRLKTLGGPLLANQVPWDSNVTGYLLRSFDTLTRRDMYTKLIGSPNVAEVEYYSYVTDQAYIGDTFSNTSNDVCTWSEGNNIDPYYQLANRPVLFYPSGAPNTDTEDTRGQQGSGSSVHFYPFDYQWAVWALVLDSEGGHECAVQHGQPDATVYGLFKPLDPNDTSALGAYRLWFFTRRGLPSFANGSQQTPCYDGSC